MGLTNEELDYLFHSGSMPAWAYYQQSNKTVSMKLQEQRQRILDDIAISIAFDKTTDEALNDVLSQLI